jgi:dinuclear metal center YbgI/SA1388 family protein
MNRIKDITDHLDGWAPQQYAESYDNVGLLVGEPSAPVKGVLVSLDCTEAVVEEAKQLGCNLIVSHHPIVFKGLKKLTGRNYVERTVISAIKNDISLYALHTNLDNVYTGVNRKISERLGLLDCRILQPKGGLLLQLAFFVPVADAEKVTQAVFAAGAGKIGNYSSCSFSLDGMGTFKPGEGSNPAMGKRDVVEHVSEKRVEVILPVDRQHAVLAALKDAHPYEEVAYYITQLVNKHQELGSGMIGTLPRAMEGLEFLDHLKKEMQAHLVRHTAFGTKPITRVAVCGGSGSFLLGAAKAQGADAFVTGDFKYHEFFDAEDKLLIADIGHYESERFTIDLIAQNIREKFSTFATHLTQVNTNPIFYH